MTRRLRSSLLCGCTAVAALYLPDCLCILGGETAAPTVTARVASGRPLAPAAGLGEPAAGPGEEAARDDSPSAGPYRGGE